MYANSSLGTCFSLPNNVGAFAALADDFFRIARFAGVRAFALKGSGWGLTSRWVRALLQWPSIFSMLAVHVQQRLSGRSNIKVE